MKKQSICVDIRGRREVTARIINNAAPAEVKTVTVDGDVFVRDREQERGLAHRCAELVLIPLVSSRRALTTGMALGGTQ